MDPAIQAAIDAAVQNALAAAAQGVPNQVAPTGAPVAQPFALTPALAYNDAIDYSTSHGAKLYKMATEPLRTEKFDVDPKSVKMFLSALKDRARSMGWTTILEIPEDAELDLHSKLRSLITQYGQITLEQIRAHANVYIAQQARCAQDSMQLYHCLMNSLSKTGLNKVTVWEEDYTIGQLPSGPMLLKVILRESHIDTRATVRHIRAKLSQMATYLPTVNNDIPAFNRYVMELIDDLNARGETTQDLLSNLFEAYKSVNDKEFVAFIKRKEEDFDLGEEIDEHKLMQLAQNKYKVLVDEKKWSAPSKEEEKIIALEAKIAQLSKRPESSHALRGSGGDKRRQTSRSNSKNSYSGNRKPLDRPAWMLKPPSNNEKGKKKTVDNKDYWWCPHHRCWCRHKPSECKGVNTHPAAPGATTTTTITNNKNRKLRLANALETVVESTEE